MIPWTPLCLGHYTAHALGYLNCINPMDMASNCYSLPYSNTVPPEDTMMFHGPILRYAGMNPLYRASGPSVLRVCKGVEISFKLTLYFFYSRTILIRLYR